MAPARAGPGNNSRRVNSRISSIATIAFAGANGSANAANDQGLGNFNCSTGAGGNTP